MSRRREVPKRKILPDPKYGDVQLAKFINALMMHGKKSVAENIIYDALDELAKKSSSKDGLEVLNKALENFRNIRYISKEKSEINYNIKKGRKIILNMSLINI